MIKAAASSTLRKVGLLKTADLIRFRYHQLRYRRENRSFLRQNPGISFPPDYLMYESFRLNYRAYFEGGRRTAGELMNRLSRHKKMEGINMLDWGCGPGRIIRHLPGILHPSCRIFGTDYNARSIQWCTEHFPDIRFNRNGLHPPMDYPSAYFDVLYGISIFTHLSESMHLAWKEELMRIMKPGGLILLTTAGKNFIRILSRPEIRQFQEGKLIIRGKVTEGHRTWSAFHPPAYIRGLFSECRVLEHLERDKHAAQGAYIPQDLWIFEKSADVT